MKLIWALLITIFISACSTTKPPKKSFRFEIKDIMSHSELSDAERYVWLGYSMALGLCIKKNNASYDSFPISCEKSARTIMAQTFEEQDNKSQYPDNYIKELFAVYQAGFMESYVWEYHKQKNWQQPINFQEFKTWSKNNLIGHTPQTKFIGKATL